MGWRSHKSQLLIIIRPKLANRLPIFSLLVCHFQASMFLNGNGVGEGTHVSVYIKILPGEYDSILKWPFSHAVSFTLYDQSSGSEKVRSNRLYHLWTCTRLIYYNGIIYIHRRSTWLRALTRIRPGRTSSGRVGSRIALALASLALFLTRRSWSGATSRTTCSFYELKLSRGKLSLSKGTWIII